MVDYSTPYADTKVNSFTKQIFHNPMGQWGSGTWNVLPAVLTTWSNLLGSQGSKSSYQLYKEQAKDYVSTAKQNAELIRNKGEIALRNLVYRNKLERGNDVLRIAASNAHLSGSNLDMLVRKERIRKMNETTLKANYNNQIMMEMVNGYRQAGQTYLTLAGKAQGDKYSAFAAILKGVETYVGLTVRDAKVEDAAQKGFAQNQIYRQITKEDQDYRYGLDVAEKPKLRARTEIEYTTPESLSLSNTLAPTPNGTLESIR